MEVKAHAEQMSDSMGLINATGTKAPDIEFLERHHIWLASGDHFGDPSWVCSSVCADAPVDIVGHDAQRSWPCTLVPAVEWIHRLLFRALGEATPTSNPNNASSWQASRPPRSNGRIVVTRNEAKAGMSAMVMSRHRFTAASRPLFPSKRTFI